MYVCKGIEGEWCASCAYTHRYIYIYIYMVRRLAFPAPPPPMVWSGTGSLELQLEKRPGVIDKASIVRKPYASHKSYNAAQ